MKFLILIILFIEILPTLAADNNFSIFRDSKDVIIIEGEISFSDWFVATGWDSTKKDLYSPDENDCQIIKKLISQDDYKFVTIGGSWCGDTKTELPKLWKVFELSDIDDEDLILIGVGRDKVIRDTNKTKYSFDRVMTLIIEKNGIEIGRIVEFPEISWEKDILNILDRQ